MNTLGCYKIVISKKLKWYCLTALIFTIQLCTKAQVVWEENFNGSSLNPQNWIYDTGDGCDRGICGWGNAELQYYRMENVKLENGNLVIEARNESFGGKSFTSGRIRTFGRVHFKYGTLEARIKIPDLKNGLWPAFWTLGAIGIWPASGEIDIMEIGQASAYPNDVNKWVGAATHWEHQGGHASYGLTYKSPVSLSDDYHVYKLVWTSAAIKVYIDDIQYYVIDISGGASADLEEFHAFHYILLNLAVGGNYTGITTTSGITAPMPAKMLVDYIKLSQNPGDSIMPVKLVDFFVTTKESKNVVISWTTTNEENSDYFIIERSTDGAAFYRIGTITSKGSLHQNHYLYEDNTPPEGINYYRLIQVDKDGKKTIYPVKQVRFYKANAVSFIVSPNPVKAKSLNLLFNRTVEKTLHVQVVNLVGKVILHVNEKPDGNILSIKFDRKPPSGVYLIKIDGIESKKILIE